MNRGVGFWKIVAWTGLLLAGALYMVDPLEPFSYSAAPIYFLAADYVGPGSFVENEVNGTPAHHDASATNNEEAAQLFGMDTEPVTDGALLDKWRRVEDASPKILMSSRNVRRASPAPPPHKS